MNIFFLDRDPVATAKYHCNRHVVKMVVETAQLLATAHRLLDGRPETAEWVDAGRTRKRILHLLPGEYWQLTRVGGQLKPSYVGGATWPLPAVTHANHPQAIWVRSSEAAYSWTFQLFEALLWEFARRYGRVHAYAKHLAALRVVPTWLPRSTGWTDPPLTMPDQYKLDDAVDSYQALYVGDKARFAIWLDGETPKWFTELVSIQNS